MDFDLPPPTPSRRRIIDALRTDMTPISPRKRQREPEQQQQQTHLDDAGIVSDSNSNSHSARSRSSSPDIPVLSPSRRGALPSAPRPIRPSSQSKRKISNRLASTASITPQEALTSTGRKVTYSRQRTFLIAQDAALDSIGDTVPRLSESPSHDDTNEREFGQLKDSQRKRRKAAFIDSQSSYSMPIASAAEEEVVSGSGSVRNIHELRRAGENARFETLADTLFDDLEDGISSTASQRFALIQICTRLLDEQFARRFLANALEKRLARYKPVDDDIICKILLVCAFGLLISLPTISSLAFRTCAKPVLLRFLLPVLEVRDDLLHFLSSSSSRLKISTAAQQSMVELRDSLRTSRVWGDKAPETFSPQLLGLRCAELIVRRVRETRDSIDTLSEPVLANIVDTPLQYSQEDQVDNLSDHALYTLGLTLSTLESYTVALKDLPIPQEKVLRRLSRLGRLSASLQKYPALKRRPLQNLEIRLFLNLTNNRPSICDQFSDRLLVGSLLDVIVADFGVISAESIDEAKRDSVLDTIILALGCLINLSELSEKARRVTIELNNGVALDALVQVFKRRRADAAEADSVAKTHLNVIFGYVSLFLCTLALDDDIRARLRRALSVPYETHDGTTTIADAGGIAQLLATVNEFLDYYRRVDEQEGGDGPRDPQGAGTSVSANTSTSTANDANFSTNNGGSDKQATTQPQTQHDPRAGFTTRLEAIVRRIQAAEGISS